MKQFYFRCRFLSDIILNAHSASEGMQETLDFIPGSSFLGIAAARYGEFRKNGTAYDVFHSGKVRFGDAHLAAGNIRSFKAPLSWMTQKGEGLTGAVRVHHCIPLAHREELTKNGIQLKQARAGWIAGDASSGKIISAENSFAIKSAYDSVRRTSRDGQMFGYEALCAGLEWIFRVDIDEQVDEKPVIESLKGEKQIGRSRSAQYGRVIIEQISNPQVQVSSSEPAVTGGKKYLALYADSRLSFAGSTGMQTLRPAAADFNLPDDWKIDWSLSQVQMKTFAPYKSINRSFEADRVCFEKGSVFVFTAEDGSAGFDAARIEQGVGEFLNEGFGRVIVNPQFLRSGRDGVLSFKITAEEKKRPALVSSVKQDSSDDLLVGWMKNMKKESEKEKEIYRSVNSFVREKGRFFSGITSSQWGQIRAIAASAESVDALVDRLFRSAPEDAKAQGRAQAGFLMHGTMSGKWKNKDVLKDELTDKRNLGAVYALRLAAQMQKNARTKGAQK